MTSKQREKLAKEEKKNNNGSDYKEPHPLMVGPGGGSGSKTRRKKVELIELRPPWHDTDPRRIGTSQKEEMLYEQQQTFAWAKSELIRFFMSRCNRALDVCDELQARNKRYEKRMVNCPIFYALPRLTKPIYLKAATEIKAFKGKGAYMAISSKSSAFAQIDFNNDRVMYNN